MSTHISQIYSLPKCMVSPSLYSSSFGNFSWTPSPARKAIETNIYPYSVRQPIMVKTVKPKNCSSQLH